MEKVLVSACLLGEKVKYHGGDARCENPILKKWEQEGRIIPVCPEVIAGLPTPRAPAEIEAGFDGLDVLEKRARVLEYTGNDVTSE